MSSNQKPPNRRATDQGETGVCQRGRAKLVCVREACNKEEGGGGWRSGRKPKLLEGGVMGKEDVMET